ncbi:MULTISPECIES: DUF2188 domain-containing protein [Lentilactobacillus]|uniref:DUF2188 domain-containing protein n=1 Tax=Lentilactobacillus hilgardii TaxID=1588 RepID=A0A6P1EB79_LENHI|nr:MULTISPECIES: DUF2188 domain-containing protein [Lentilactobacillus]MQM78844.1 DUF2188 domain-containing protein [Lentilactobacillus buchneri]MQM88835.1 DUF2188 domain-containing protein [Lentilactobacillus buchneri]MQN21047.1 DUF2188 domain-containing protein [Lentilactobacillus buchneri]QHB52471.1 DUF2188 domain-containing protein [Lentilactobacillus hilgardii]
MAKQNQWVSPHNGKWSVTGEGNSRASKVFDKKSDALAYGKSRAMKTNGELIGQGKNGQINLKNSYGKDPFPPRDKD